MLRLTKDISERMAKDLGGEGVKTFVKTIVETTDAGSFVGMVISTEHVDRVGDMLMRDGMDSKFYERNPVILNSHNSWGIENIIGATTRLYPGMVDGVKAWLADGNWAPTEQGQTARKLWDAKILAAASVGYIPEEFDPNNNSIVTKWQLLEYSPVAIPCNAYATRLKAIGETPAGLRAKGFEVDENDKVEEKKVEPVAPVEVKEAEMTVEKAIEVISKSSKETIRAAVSVLSDLAKAEADNQVGTKGRTPPGISIGGGRQIRVRAFNGAIRRMLKTRANLKN